MNGLKPLLVMLALSSPLVLSTSAQAQSSKRKGSRGKPVDCFKEQTYKLPKLLQLMSELTRKNFILNEKLKNKEVTIYCERSVSVNEMYRVFISALAIHKLTIVRVGKFYRVTAMKDAKGAPSPTYLGSTEGMPYDERLVTLIHKLKHMDASVIQKVIKSMVGKNGKLEVLPPRLLVISDNALNIRRLLKVIEHLDTEGGSQRIHFYEARYAEAQSLAAKLKEVFEVEGKNKSKKKKSSSKKKSKDGETSPDEVVLDRVVADERTNQLIIVAPEAAFKKAKDLLDKLDVPTPDDEGAIHVIRLENATAKDLAGTLSGLITGVTSGRKTKSKKKSSSSGRATSDPEGLFQGEVKVSADEPTNSLVVVASRNDLRVLKNIVQKLDYRRPQVFVEAAFLELTINDNSKIGAGMHSGITTQGTDWEDGDFEFLKDGGGVVNLNTGLNSLTSGLGQIASQGLVGTFQGMPIPGLDAILPDNMTLPTFGIVLQALQGNGAVDVLSTPHLLTTDNEEAEIVVGENVPFASGLTGGLGGLSNLLGGANSGTASAATSALSGLGGLGIPSVSIQRQDVALKFKLTPHITNTGHVRMELEVEISELGEIEPTTRSPRTTQRKLKTTVLAMDNQTIVIGGLISDKQTESENRIPFLSRIPLLGHLFKTRETKTAKTNLLMVLTPHVVRDQKDFARIHREKMQERKALASLVNRRHSSLPPSVNWRRKIGAFARIERVLKTEESRIENGGQGDGTDAVISPEATSDVETEKASTEKEDKETENTGDKEPKEGAKEDNPKTEESPQAEPKKPAGKGAQ